MEVKYTAVLIDDEENALDVLSMQLASYCPYVEVKKKCLNGLDGVEAITQIKPDIVFLDIEMPKMNGFEVLDQTKNFNYKVIFTTAYDQFAIKAFRYSALDYLLKPIDIEELKVAVKKIVSNESSDLTTKLELLRDELGMNKLKSDKIALPFGEAYEMILLSDIIRCESDSNYTTFYLVGKRKSVISKTLKEVEESLQNSTFFRLHNSHIINLDHVLKFYKVDGGYVVMKDGAQINISRTKKEEFYELMRKV